MSRTTRTTRPRSLLLLLPLVAGGCGDELAGGLRQASGSLARATKAAVPGPAPVSLSQARPPWRYISLVKKTASEACPTPLESGWQVRPLFRQGEAQLLLEGNQLPAALERFCEYAWTKAPQDPASPPAFAAADAAKVVRIDPDRDLVVPQVPTASLTQTSRYLGGEADLRASLASAYQTQAGATPAALVAKEPSAAPVVAVVDSVGFADAGAGYAQVAPRMQHGLAIAGFIRDVRCPDGDATCRGRLFHAQAFPYTASSPLATPAGGPLGSLGSLARAVGEAVVRWRRMPAPRGPLIVNLSLGWDPALADLSVSPADHMNLLKGDNAAVPATVQAVHAGLAWASCNQALLIAAAGNSAGEPCADEGPLAPAAWERLPSASAAQCAALFGAAEVIAPPEGSDPAGGSLVYAAAGLTYADAPLPNARPGSLPGRALPAFQAVSASVRGRTDGWTGSSVAAATLSGLAARAWSIAPSRSPRALIQAIDPSGQSLGRSAALHRYDRPAPPVRRLTAHAAFAAVCADVGLVGGACPNPYLAPSMTSLQGQVGAALALQSHAAAIGAPRIVPNLELGCTSTPLSCDGARLHRCRKAAGNLAPAPAPAPTAAEPWTRPQPDTPICPVCPIQGGDLYISPNPSATGAGTSGAITLRDPRLRFRLSDGAYVIAELADLVVSAATVRVDLGGYRVVIDGDVSPLDQLLSSQQIAAGELEFSVLDSAGRPAVMISDISVHP